MPNWEISPLFKSTCATVPSPTATHTACLSGPRLQIRCLATLEIVRSIPIPSTQDLRTSRIAWSPPSVPKLPDSTATPESKATPRLDEREPALRSNRVLVFDENTARVFDLRDEKWSAVVSNGSGGMGKNVHVEFGATEDEVVVWSDFCACVKVWCLKSGRAVEIRDPKFHGKDGKGWGYRPSLQHNGAAGKGAAVLALLCRSAGTDVLLLLAPHTYALLSRTELPTVDAAGLKWSRDGRWLAIWESASAGYRLCIYTADGHLYRSIVREPSDEASEWDVEGLGIKSVEWVPGNERLAIGGWDRRVRILSTRTFSPLVLLDHTPIIHVPSTPVYTELVAGNGLRSYALTPQPVTPPKAPPEKNEPAAAAAAAALTKHGIGLLTFNADGTLCATRDDATPSVVWIWDLRTLTPRIILIQYAPVKTLAWHPTDPTLLLVQTAHDDPTLYLYTASSSSSTTTTTSNPQTVSPPAPPSILSLGPHLSNPTATSAATTTPKSPWTTTWLSSSSSSSTAFSLANHHVCVFVWPLGKQHGCMVRGERGRNLREGGEEEGEEGEMQRRRRRNRNGSEGDGSDDENEESDDSLYDILTGRTPVPVPVQRVREDGSRNGYVDGEEEEEEEEEGGEERYNGDGDGDDDGRSERGVVDLDLDVDEYAALDDTFRTKRERGPTWTRARGQSVFDDSGLDEMF